MPLRTAFATRSASVCEWRCGAIVDTLAARGGAIVYMLVARGAIGYALAGRVLLGESQQPGVASGHCQHRCIDCGFAHCLPPGQGATPYSGLEDALAQCMAR